MSKRLAVMLTLLLSCLIARCDAATVALWLFDEQVGVYPSCVLGDAASGNFPLVIGPGGQIVEGQFGNALEPVGRPRVDYPQPLDFDDSAKRGQFGLIALDKAKQDLNWHNAMFCALMTRGDHHLRQEVGFGSPTESSLNLGANNWTVEFWYQPTRPSERSGVVFEIGSGPRDSGHPITRLSLNQDAQSFTLLNEPSNTRMRIESSAAALDASQPRWHHLAFVYDTIDQQVRHYVDGILQKPPKSCQLKPLPVGENDYMSIGRDGHWQHRLPGRLDELRFSDAQVYQNDFAPPPSFSKYGSGYSPPTLKRGLPLLFGENDQPEEPVQLGSRKHLFFDDALIAELENVEFRSNPPRLAELVINQRGISNHLVVFEDVASGDGLIRLYRSGPNRSLDVWTSRDGVHFTAPDLGRDFRGARNVVVEDPVGLGTVFVDPNASVDERIKYFSGYRGRGCYVYSSADGYHFTRNETSALPFRAASQSLVFYDDQRQKYVGYHRSDMARTEGGKSARTSVMTETTDLMRPWPLTPVSQAEQSRLSKTRKLGRKNPYYVDNGPLTPPGFGVEYPTVFASEKSLDPVGVDVYVPKCVKYEWADDAYLAFPLMYFHYH
ncbi:MAG: LamG domain-containing protein, partial [Planctomycetes bacterium]|nr:LamG domain-containing protein [Planctomycetota bacterium]